MRSGRSRALGSEGFLCSRGRGRAWGPPAQDPPGGAAARPCPQSPGRGSRPRERPTGRSRVDATSRALALGQRTTRVPIPCLGDNRLQARRWRLRPGAAPPGAAGRGPGRLPWGRGFRAPAGLCRGLWTPRGSPVLRATCLPALTRRKRTRDARIGCPRRPHAALQDPVRSQGRKGAGLAPALRSHSRGTARRRDGAGE